MKKPVPISDMFPNKCDRLFGTYFHNCEHLSYSSKAISNLYKVIYILYYLFILFLKLFKIRVNNSKLDSIRVALYKAHIYGIPIYHKSVQDKIDLICGEHNLSPSSKIILGFSRNFMQSANKTYHWGKECFEKGIFILFSSGFFMVFMSFFLYSTINSFQQKNLLMIIIVSIFLVLYFLTSLFIALIMKGALWDVHDVMRKISLSDNSLIS